MGSRASISLSLVVVDFGTPLAGRVDQGNEATLASHAEVLPRALAASLCLGIIGAPPDGDPTVCCAKGCGSSKEQCQEGIRCGLAASEEKRRAAAASVENGRNDIYEEKHDPSRCSKL